MPPAKTSEKPARVLGRDFVASTLHDILLEASALPVAERVPFLERKHAFWGRAYARQRNNLNYEGENERQIMLAVWDMLEELTR